MQSPFIRNLPDDIQRGIAESGIRNSHLLAIAPTGTISLLAGNVSSGLEPIFAASYRRKILDEAGTAKDFLLTDYALGLWRAGAATGLPNGFAQRASFPSAPISTCRPPCSHSSTIRFPRRSMSQKHTLSDDFQRIYDLAYDMGLKGCTTFRPNPVTGTVLSEEGSGTEAPHCCVLEREAD